MISKIYSKEVIQNIYIKIKNETKTLFLITIKKINKIKIYIIYILLHQFYTSISQYLNSIKPF